MSDELKTIAAKYSEQCEYIYMDLNDPDTIDEAIDRISVEKIDYMINNAATSAGVGPIYQYKDEIKMVFQVNVFGHMKVVSRAYERGLLINGCSVINVTSMAAFNPIQLLGAYCVSKAAFEAYSRCLAKELADKNIRINSVGISADTDLYHTHAIEKAKWGYEKTINRIRAGEHMPDPYNATFVVAFLASEESTHITGQHIECNSMDVMI